MLFRSRVPLALEKYKNILYNTFHSSGSELFGKLRIPNYVSSNLAIIYEPTSASTFIYPTGPVSLRADSTDVTVDNDIFTVDAQDA